MRRSWLRLFWLAVVLVGCVAGYLASSGLGTRLLHREIEIQLSRLLAGPVAIGEVDVSWADGLRVEARDVSAYYSRESGPEPGAPPALSSRRVLAWVDLVALLVGRLELSTLTLEGPQVRVVRSPDGHFVGLPLPPVSAYPDEGLDDRDGAERFFADLAALDGVARRFAERFQAADRIEIVDGLLTWSETARQPTAGSPDSEPPPALRFELLNGFAEKDWITGAVALEMKGVLVDGRHVPFPFDLSVARAEQSRFRWSLALSRIPLAAAETPLATLRGGAGIADLTGTLDVRLALESEIDGLHRLAVEGRVDDATVSLRDSGSQLERDRIDFRADLDFDPARVRLVSARVDGSRLNIELEAEMRRPLQDTSATRIASRMRGIELEDIREIARYLEDEYEAALTISRLTERVESGRIRYVEAAGSAPLGHWRDLVAGRIRELPEGLLLGGAVEDLTVSSGPSDKIENLSAEIEWVGDRIRFRNGNARFRDGALPELDLTIEGVSQLVRASESARRIRHTPPPLPGLGPLGEILAPRDPDALPPVERIGLALDFLEHPILRWPAKDLRLLIEPLRRGVEITVREGVWGGAAVSGDLVWFDDPRAPTLSANLTLAPVILAEGPVDEPEVLTDPEDDGAIADDENGRWGEGRFEMTFRPRRWLPFQRATGHLRLEDASFVGNDLEIDLAPEGRIAARMVLGLGAPEKVDFDASFALTEGLIEEVDGLVNLPDELARGRVGATGTLKGPIRSKRTFVHELDGRIRAEARNGVVYTRLPLMFRLAEATEGYNPFAGEERLHYETMSGTIELTQGVLSIADFEIEGPLRVFARADLDTRQRPTRIRAVVGIFLFRRPNQILENLPLVRSLLPGSERGLIGAYFDVVGPVAEPRVEALPLQTMMSAVPNAIKAPFKVLRLLFDRPENEG